MSKADKFLHDFIEWAKEEWTIKGVALVGSYARGDQRKDSDIDLVIVAGFPEDYLRKNEWVERFGNVKRIDKEDWGILHALRVFYENGLEVEFGLTHEFWAKINPVDLGIKRVVKNGFKILYDTNYLLDNLVEVIKG